VDSLVARALERRPDLLAHVAAIEAQESSVRLARAERWPSPGVSVGYGQRDGHPDFLNATLSVALPVFAGRKQSAAVREEEAVLARERAGHGWMVAEIESEVRDAYADILDAVGQLALLREGLLARAEANLDAALAGYRAGREDFLTLLDGQSTLYRYQLERHRRLADLLAAWASLERAVGEEIEP
jgi:outer membrane protein, heavy metal efflux system